MSDTDAEKQLLFDQIHRQFRHAVSYNLYTGLAFGMLVVVYFISIRIQLGSLFHSPGHMFMFGSTTLIFVLATVVIIVGAGLTLQPIPGVIRFIDPSISIGWSIHKIDVMAGVVAAPVISDMVCAWRAVVLWKYDRRVVFILSACITGTFAVSIYDLKLALKNHPGPNGGGGIDEGKVAAIIVGPMLGTNILSTLLIAWKAWEYRNTVSAHLRKGSASDRAEKVLALLIESGFVYCLLWIFYLLTATSVLPGSGSYIVNLVMLFISSMYPAIIIIIACTQIGQEGYNTRPDAEGLDLTTIRFSIGENTTGDISLPTTSVDRGKANAVIPVPLSSHTE
ncbi:hypothetical protein EDB92DRAFT_1853160 [Lactarius akahatsu]|uniref:Uncharacterized protein n=1 Tax=Lactarius akahatsu TaxID=416441 RepID=A0AAD4LNN4_9AGAM|nr:hypothetical protein EDB92DRAFT_1853160 [Lactarius akahatsu]